MQTEPSFDALIDLYIRDQENSETNWMMAMHYESIGQTASALSFYLRAAERGEDPLLRYECLIRGALCYYRQGIRNFTVRGMLQHAVCILPQRPEAYYWLSVVCEHTPRWDGNWFDSYLYCTLGLNLAKDMSEIQPLRTSVGYSDTTQLVIQKAHTSWWCGLCDQSREIYLNLYNNFDLTESQKANVYDNLVRLNAFQSKSLTLYDSSKHDQLHLKFEGSEKIEGNYSESYQDLFVLTMLNGKSNGTYLEVGAGDHEYGSNTKLLENLGWTGVGLDLSEDFVRGHAEHRSNSCLLKDATLIDYNSFLAANEFPKEIDYLQVDTDPADVSLKVLKSIPFDNYKFAVVTFEHDKYTDPDSTIQQQAKTYLEAYGYNLVVNNISPDDNRPYEDWYVHPDLIDKDILQAMTVIDEQPKMAEKYMMRGEL